MMQQLVAHFLGDFMPLFHSQARADGYIDLC